MPHLVSVRHINALSLPPMHACTPCASHLALGATRGNARLQLWNLDAHSVAVPDACQHRILSPLQLHACMVWHRGVRLVTKLDAGRAPAACRSACPA